MQLPRTIENGNLKVITPGGVKEFKYKPHTDDLQRAQREAARFEREYIFDLAKRLGREPTQTEILDGKVASATDSRTFAEKYRDANFKVAQKGERSQLHRMLDAADDEVEKERYSKLSPAEQRREDIARMLVREEVEADLKASHVERLAKHAQTIEQLKARQHALNWSPEADEKDRVLIAQALQIIETENSDLQPLQSLLNQIDERAEVRRQNKIAELVQQSEALAAQQAAITEQQTLAAEGGNDAGE